MPQLVFFSYILGCNAACSVLLYAGTCYYAKRAAVQPTHSTQSTEQRAAADTVVTVTGSYVGNIYVDSEATLHASRKVWAMLREMASFEWAASNGVKSVRITQGSTLTGAFNFSQVVT